MRKLGITFLAISTAIVLLHSFTPHTHDNNIESATFNACDYSQETGILGLFQMIFHQDLGEEHLELYVNAVNFDISIDAFTPIPLVLIPVVTLSLEQIGYPNIIDIIPREQWRLSPLDQRGPPNFI